MGLIDRLTSFDAGKPRIGDAVKARLIIIYIIGGTIALAANLILGPFGLDLTAAQLRALLLFLSVGVVVGLVTDVVLIVRNFRPVDAYLKSRPAAGAAAPDTERAAFARAINLPALSVLRVEFIHIPIGILSVLTPAIACHALGLIRFSLIQFVLIVILGLMNGTIHSIIEYYLVSKLSRNLLHYMYEGAPGASYGKADGVLFVNAKVKFYFIYFLISVMPLLFLGVTLIFKMENLLAEKGVAPGAVTREIIPWAVLFIIISTAASFIMSFILSREIIGPVGELSESMKMVEKGKFDEALHVTTADEFSELFRGFNSMTEGLMERETIKRKFGRYVSESVLRDILEKDLSLGGEEKTVTILFSDIRDYTGLAENKSATDIVTVLNAYFSEMVKVVEKHNGILDKFIGDALMAVFGAPLEDERHADNALSAAVEMLERLEEFNRSASLKGWRKLEIGIGISTGKVLVGNIGSESRMEYTVIGDTVNLASRLETLTKETGRRILFSDSTRESVTLPLHFTEVGTFDIKGRKTPCIVFTIDRKFGNAI